MKFFLKLMLKLVIGLAGVAVVAVGLNVVIDILYKNSKKYFSAY